MGFENAEAGPSTQGSSQPSNDIPDIPSLYLPHAPPPRNQIFFRSTDDLLGRFLLHPAYDKYVRSADIYDPTSEPGPTDKGKGRETVGNAASEGAEDHDGTKGDKKSKNNYKHLIKGVPGKHSMKKDEYLATMIQVPPKQRIRIRQFDEYTQNEAFSMSPEGITNWNIGQLVAPSAQEREDKRKRKEMKKLAKARALGLQQQPAQVASATAVPKLTGSTPQTATPRTSAGTPRPGSTKPITSAVNTHVVAQPRANTPARAASAGTPASATVSTPVRTKPTATMSPRPNPVPARPPEKRKREGTDVGGATVGLGPPMAIVGAKAGHPNARPRPVKKARLARDPAPPLQQPTPQGA